MLQGSQYWLGSYTANQKFFEELLSAASVRLGSIFLHREHTAILILIRGEPERAPNTRDTGSGFICIYVYIYINKYIMLYVCGVIISMTEELNFESRTWVMVVKHVYTLTKISAETGKQTKLTP